MDFSGKDLLDTDAEKLMLVDNNVFTTVVNRGSTMYSHVSTC